MRTLLILLILLSGCGTTHVEFTINWTEVWKVVGYCLFGGLIVFLLILYKFRDFRL